MCVVRPVARLRLEGRSSDGLMAAGHRAAGPRREAPQCHRIDGAGGTRAPICRFAGCPARRAHPAQGSRCLRPGRLAAGLRHAAQPDARAPTKPTGSVDPGRIRESEAWAPLPRIRRVHERTRGLSARRLSSVPGWTRRCSRTASPSLALADGVRLFCRHWSLLGSAWHNHPGIALQRRDPMPRPRRSRPGTASATTPLCDATPARGTP